MTGVRLQGVRAGYASEMIRRGTSQVIPEPELRWFIDKKLVDVSGELECELYWQAVRDGVLDVQYAIKVDNSRPHFALWDATVSTGLIVSPAAVKMMEHAIALGLCYDGPLTIVRKAQKTYQVVAR